MSEEAEERERALAFSLRSLGKKSQLTREMEKKLILRGYSQEIVNQVIAYLTERGYLDDQAWIQRFVEAAQRKKEGPKATLQKLRVKGIDKREAELAVASFNSQDQSKDIQYWLKTRYAKYDLNDHKERHKVFSALVRKGFDFEAVISALAP